MDKTSFSLILNKLETAMAVGQAMAHAAKAAGMSANTLTELATTLDIIDCELQEMRSLLKMTSVQKMTPPTVKKTVGHTETSPYYWEDDYSNE